MRERLKHQKRWNKVQKDARYTLGVKEWILLGIVVVFVLFVVRQVSVLQQMLSMKPETPDTNQIMDFALLTASFDSTKSDPSVNTEMGATYYWYPLSESTVAAILERDKDIQVLQSESSDLRRGNGVSGLSDLKELTHSVRLSLCYMYRPMHKARVEKMNGRRKMSANPQWTLSEKNRWSYVRLRSESETNQFNSLVFFH